MAKQHISKKSKWDTTARLDALWTKFRRARREHPDVPVPDALRLNSRQQRALVVTVIIALLAGFMLLRSFITVIALSFIAAVIFYPLYAWIDRKLKRPGMSAMLTFILMLLAIIIPLALTILLTIGEIRHLISDLSNLAGNPTSLTDFGNQLLKGVNNFLDTVTQGAYHLTADQLRSYIADATAALASFFLNLLTSSFTSIASLTTQFIIFLYIFTSLLQHAEQLRAVFRTLNPLGGGISSLYLARTGEMTRGIVGGQFVIALCQGFVEAIFLYIAGIHYFFFMMLLLTFMSIIPLGGGILTIPIGIIMILTGNIWQGAVILLGHFVVITNIDNVLRPRLVPRSVRMNSALMMLAVFGGLGIFGFLGIAVGPIIMILVVSTLQIYLPLAEARQLTTQQATSRKR